MSTATDKTGMRRSTPTWPRFTPTQKDLLLSFERARHGNLHVDGGRLRVSIYRLLRDGMLDGGSGGWYSITQRGRDYVRFGMRRRKP